METNETYYINLITSYFNGEASEEDIRFLEVWVKAGPANAKLFAEHAKIWSLLQREKIETGTDLDAEWRKFRFVNRQSSIINRNDLTPQPPLLEGEGAIGDSPSITPPPFGGGRVGALRIAALILLLAIPSYLAYRYFMPAASIQLAAENSVREILLPDSTSVTLDAGSTLEYPEKFKGSTRGVKLNGKAYFIVKHDAEHPFIVSGGEVRVKVLGTQFNVNTSALNGSMEVVLTSGKVSVYFKEQSADPVILSPGDKAEVPADLSGISKSVNDDPNYMAWKTRHFVFANTRLDEVVVSLSAAYHITIRLNQEKLGNCRITATFDKQSLESVLNVLKATLDLQISNNGSGFEISGKGCN